MGWCIASTCTLDSIRFINVIFFENAWINYCPLLKNGVDHDGQSECVDTNNSEIEVVTLCLDVVKVCMTASNVVEKAPFSILSCLEVFFFRCHHSCCICHVVFFWHSLHRLWYLNVVFSPLLFFSLFTGVKWVRTPAWGLPLSTALIHAF